MLNAKDAMPTIAVRSLKAAKTFYENKLGLEPVDTGEAGVTGYRSGKTTVLVYESQFAGTNKATAATWIVGSELDTIVRTLKARGVGFEHYDLPETKRDGDIHVSGNTRVAWTKDPDGNILALVNG